MQATRGAAFRAGARAIAPLAVAVVPFGLLFGSLAARSGLSPAAVTLMSALVFAGSAQFVAVGIWQHPAPWLLLTLSTALINSRHLLMGASLAPRIACWRHRTALPALFLMADEVWALAETRARVAMLEPAYYFGLGLVLWFNWVLWSGAGALLGPLLGNPTRYGADFAFSAVFLALLVGLWRGRATALAVAASAASATAVHLAFPGPWYVAAGGLAGVLAGALAAPAGESRAPA